MEEERNIITFFCFSGANGHGVGNSEMVYCYVSYSNSVEALWMVWMIL